MGARTAEWPENGGPQKYRMGSGVSVSRQRTGAPGKATAFVKNAHTGRLLRLGAEETFLLTEVAEGRDPGEIAERFSQTFGRTVREATIGAFIRQMLDHGVLAPVEDAELVDERPDGGESTANGAAATPAKGEIWRSDGFGPEAGGDDGLADLEEAIYGEGAAPRKPAPDPHAASTSGKATQGGPDPADCGPARADPGGERVSWSFRSARAGPQDTADDAPGASEAQEQAPQVRPELARAHVRFRDRLDERPPRPGGMLSLFDPTGLLRFLSDSFGWLRLFDGLIYLLALFAVLVTLNRLSQYGVSVVSGFGGFSMLGVLFISLMTVNLFGTLIPAVAAHRHGAEIRHFGFMFVLFVIPRFAVDMSGLMLLGREGRLAYHGAALKTRLLLFSVATVIWAVTRQSPTMIPDIAFVVSQIALVVFLFTAFPLLPGDGYKWLAAYFDQPLLRQRAFYHVFGLNRKLVEHLPPPTSGEKWAFALYAVGSALVTGFLVSFLALHMTTALEGRFGGTGLLIFLGLLGAVAAWVAVMKRAFRKSGEALVRRTVARHMAGKPANLPAVIPGARAGGARLPVPAGPGGALVKRGTLLPDRPQQMPLAGVYSSARKSPWRWLRRGLAVAALAALVYAAFLPYSYETGGDFVILPDQRSKVSARIEGELVEIYIEEGDIVQAGQPLARLSDLTPQHAVASVEAELEKARAVLARLEAGATQEEIQVAREQVALAETELPFKKAQAERAEELFARGTIPEREFDAYRSDYAVARQALRAAQANLANVEAPASAADIRVARADIARLEAELAFHRKRLSEVVIRAPVTGKVVTENVRLVLGQHMEEGALFVEIENHEIARAEVQVPEADIGLVEPGDAVRLKAWASSTEERVGEVVSVAPQAEQVEFGRTVRVKTEFDNANGFFRPGMTGYAKIDGMEMKSWQAFTRLVDRFFRIEVWGWIP